MWSSELQIIMWISAEQGPIVCSYPVMSIIYSSASESLLQGGILWDTPAKDMRLTVQKIHKIHKKYTKAKSACKQIIIFYI